MIVCKSWHVTSICKEAREVDAMRGESAMECVVFVKVCVRKTRKMRVGLH